MATTRKSTTKADDNTTEAPAESAAQTFSVDTLLTQAADLRNEKVALQERTKANRDLLRLMDGAGALTDEQSAWLAEHYPVVTRKRATEDAPESTDAE